MTQNGVGTTNWVKEGGRLFVIRSLNDGLDINGVAGTVQLGAHGSKGHTDDLQHERMVAFFSVGPPFFAVVTWRMSFFQV